MYRKEGTMSPVLPGANEESLDRHRSAFGREREDVGVAQAISVNRMAALDVGERAQPISVQRG